MQIFKLISTCLTRLNAVSLFEILASPKQVQERQVMNLTVQAANLALQNEVL